MLYWLTIIIGIIMLSLSISNPFYNLVIKKKINTNILMKILIRILLFILGILSIMLGLYIESVPN